MAATVIRNLALNFVARTDSAVKGIKRMKREATGLVSGISRVGGKIAAVGALVGVSLSAASAVAFVKSQFETIDALAKTSDKLSIATEDLAAFGLQADLAGVSMETFQTSAVKMVRSIADAAQDLKGSSPAAKAFRALGLDPKALQLKPVAQAFIDVGEAIDRVKNPQSRIDLATQIFGRGGTGILPMLKNLRDEFRLSEEKARKFGLAISRIDATKIERANDAITELKALLTGAATQIAVKFAPIVERLANTFVNWATENDRLIKTIERLSSIVGNKLASAGLLGDQEKRLAELRKEYDILKDYQKWGESALQILKSGSQVATETGQLLVNEKGDPIGIADLNKWLQNQAAAIADKGKEINKLLAEMDHTAEGRDAKRRLSTESTNALNVAAGGAKSVQGPQGLARGSAEAAAAEAKFLNRLGGSDSSMIDEQKKSNTILQSINGNILRLYQQSRNGVGIN